MTEPIVSVIIPAYNSELYISETINSVIEQSLTNIEIFIIDDGSIDNQNSIIEQIISKDDRAILIKQKNQGVSAARNKGIKNAHGKYLAFLDADDVWLQDNLELKVKLLNDSHFGLVHSAGEIIDQNSIPNGKILSGKEGRLLDDLLSWNGPHIPGPSSILVTKEVIEEVGVFDIHLSTSADQDLFIRIASQYEIGMIEKITWQYREHTHGMHNNIAMMEHDVLKIYQKTSKNGLFKNSAFEQMCYAKMYMILALSWIGDGNNYFKGLKFALLSIYHKSLQLISSYGSFG